MMWSDQMHTFGAGFPLVGTWGLTTTTFFFILIVWSLVWKGLALWAAVERKEKFWFIVFLIINTIGILEIIYLAFIAKKRPHHYRKHHTS